MNNKINLKDRMNFGFSLGTKFPQENKTYKFSIKKSQFITINILSSVLIFGLIAYYDPTIKNTNEYILGIISTITVPLMIIIMCISLGYCLKKEKTES